MQLIKLLRKEICIVLLGLFLFAVLPIFPVYADKYDFKYSSVIIHESVPVGSQLRFQTPPLKKNEKPCYTAGDGSILHTFIAGKPIDNTDGTTRYRLGCICCKTGETGLYINWNGQKRILYSIQVVDGQFKKGFPLSTSFGQIFKKQKIEKIIITEGGTIKKRQIQDIAQINKFMAKLAPERLYRDCSLPTKKVGFTFTVDFYIKGQKGYYRYILANSFIKVDSFSASFPTGNCVEENTEEVSKIIANLFTSLK